MSRLLKYGVPIFVSVTLVLILGCGPRQRKAGTNGEEAEASHLGETLKLRILGPDAQDPRYPNRGADSSTEPVVRADVVIANNLITYLRPFQFSDQKKPLFFTWDENAFGSPVRVARFSIKKEIPTGQAQGTPEAQLSESDYATGRWFISFERVIPDRPQDLDPSIWFHLTLDLILADGKRVVVEVRFRAVGPLPRMTPTPAPLVGFTTNPTEFGQAISAQGLVVNSEQFQNPTHRWLTLWLKVPSSSFTLRTYISIGRFSASYVRGAVSPNWLSYDSLVHLGVTEIRVHDSEDSSVITETSMWHHFNLKPDSSIIVDWVARLEPGTFHCQPPDPEAQTYVVAAGRGGPPAVTYNVNMSWGVTAVSLAGNWSRDARVSDTADVDPNGIQEINWPRVIPIAMDTYNFSRAYGGAPGIFKGGMGCQGIY